MPRTSILGLIGGIPMEDLSMASKRKSAPVYKPGFIEQELRLLATEPHREMFGQDYRHAIGMLAAGILMILDRLPVNGSK